MNSGSQRWSLGLVVAGLALMLVALLDPLEGFPLVLVGGALAAVAARLAASRWFPLVASGLGLAAVGCGAMLLLSARGGIGGSTGLPAAWGLTVAPYPAGVMLLLAGDVLLIRQLWASVSSWRGAAGGPTR